MKGKKLPEPWGEPRGVTAAPDPEEEEEEEEKKEEEEEVEEEEEEEERLQERSSQRVRGCPGAVRGRRALRCPQHSLTLSSSSRCRRSNRCRWVGCWGRVGGHGGRAAVTALLGEPPVVPLLPCGVWCSISGMFLGTPWPWVSIPLGRPPPRSIWGRFLHPLVFHHLVVSTTLRSASPQVPHCFGLSVTSCSPSPWGL